MYTYSGLGVHTREDMHRDHLLGFWGDFRKFGGLHTQEAPISVQVKHNYAHYSDSLNCSLFSN